MTVPYTLRHRDAIEDVEIRLQIRLNDEGIHYVLQPAAEEAAPPMVQKAARGDDLRSQ